MIGRYVLVLFIVDRPFNEDDIVEKERNSIVRFWKGGSLCIKRERSNGNDLNESFKFLH